MLLEAQSKDKPGGVLIDLGTMKRVPFAFKADMATGHWWAFQPTPDGKAVVSDISGNPLVIRGRAVGQLKLISFKDAELLHAAPAPRIPVKTLQPMSMERKIDGVEQYKKLYYEVWNGMRGEAKRTIDDRWMDYMRENNFLDAFVLKLRSRPVSVQS